MTEAVILALIALASSLIFATTSVSLAKIIIKSKPSSFKFETSCGTLEIDYEK